MVLLSYSLPLSLDAPVMTMLSHPITTISSNLSMISIMINCFPATLAAAIRDQQDVRKIVQDQNSIRLASSLSQLNQLIFFSPLKEESYLSIMMKK